MGRGCVRQGGNDGSVGRRGCTDVAVWGPLPPPYGVHIARLVRRLAHLSRDPTDGRTISEGGWQGTAGDRAFMAKRSPEIAIFGSYPPPYGGMSVHVKRLLPLLARAGVTYRVYTGVGDFAAPPDIVNISRNRLRTALAELLGGRHRLYYVFAIRTPAHLWAGLMAFTGRRILLTIGGQSLERALTGSNRLARWAARFALRRVWGVIGVNERICQFAAQVRGSMQRVWRIPAFLRPAVTEEGVRDAAVEEFLARHSPALIAMGCLSGGGTPDIYGVHALVELVSSLRRQYPRIGLLVALTSGNSMTGRPWEEMQRLLRDRRLAGDFWLRPAGGELAPWMARFDLMVRPSTTDGDSVAVREALWCGVPVVASDCVRRPPGVIVHRTGDAEDLRAKVSYALGHLEAIRHHVRQVRPRDNWPVLKCVLAEGLGRELLEEDCAG